MPVSSPRPRVPEGRSGPRSRQTSAIERPEPIPYAPRLMGHRLAWWVPLLVGAAVVVGCSDSNPTGSFELTGRVLEVNTERPVSGAVVTFRSDTLYTSEDRTSDGG